MNWRNEYLARWIRSNCLQMENRRDGLYYEIEFGDFDRSEIEFLNRSLDGVGENSHYQIVVRPETICSIKMICDAMFDGYYHVRKEYLLHRVENPLLREIKRLNEEMESMREAHRMPEVYGKEEFLEKYGKRMGENYGEKVGKTIIHNFSEDHNDYIVFKEMNEDYHTFLTAMGRIFHFYDYERNVAKFSLQKYVNQEKRIEARHIEDFAKRLRDFGRYQGKGGKREGGSVDIHLILYYNELDKMIYV